MLKTSGSPAKKYLIKEKKKIWIWHLPLKRITSPKRIKKIVLFNKKRCVYVAKNVE